MKNCTAGLWMRYDMIHLNWFTAITMRYESFQIRRDTIHKNVNLGTPIMLCHDSLKFQHDSILSYCNANAQLNTIPHGKKKIFLNCIITFSPSVCVQPMRLACDFWCCWPNMVDPAYKKICRHLCETTAATRLDRCSPCQRVRMLSVHPYAFLAWLPHVTCLSALPPLIQLPLFSLPVVPRLSFVPAHMRGWLPRAPRASG